MLTVNLILIHIFIMLQITQTLSWLVQMVSAFETDVVAVERMKEYAETPQVRKYDKRMRQHVSARSEWR